MRVKAMGEYLIQEGVTATGADAFCIHAVGQNEHQRGLGVVILFEDVGLEFAETAAYLDYRGHVKRLIANRQHVMIEQGLLPGAVRCPGGCDNVASAKDRNKHL